MALSNYSVFRGTVDSFHPERDDDESPHFQLYLRAGSTTVRCAVNVKSKVHPSQVAFLIDRRFTHPLTADIQSAAPGYTALPSSGRRGLDYIRSNLFDLQDVIALPADAPGEEDDLQDMVLSLCQSAQEASADVYAFGEPFPNGVHDIHMNQGNTGQFAGDNGIYQDGGLLFHFATSNRWAALFLAFQSQAIHTDDRGAPLPNAPTFAEVIAGGDVQPIPAPVDPVVVAREHAVRIIAALVNPEGPENQPAHAGRPESITLFNYSPNDVSLNGWRVRVNNRDRILPAQLILAGAPLHLDLAGNPPLGNKGGTITLLDDHATKVHGVSYTKEQAREEGWSVCF